MHGTSRVSPKYQTRFQVTQKEKSWEESHMGGEAGRRETNFGKSRSGFMQYKKTRLQPQGQRSQEMLQGQPAQWPDRRPVGRTGVEGVEV